ncbi:MAG: guanylate kinase [Cyanobacteria bacterium]|nr:guanylate kinase [Cyanobacteriota bacterium]
MSQGQIFIISGPSGVGKGTLCQRLKSSMPSLHLITSTTTRPQRPGEVDQVDYFFVTRDEFLTMIEKGDFLEWAQYNQHYYGTPKPHVDQLRAQGHHVLLEIDTQGAFEVKKLYPEAFLIFIAPPSLSELKRRLEERGTNSPEEIQQRLSITEEELTLQKAFDFSVINHTLDQTEKELYTLIDTHLKGSV